MTRQIGIEGLFMVSAGYQGTAPPHVFFGIVIHPLLAVVVGALILLAVLR
jgi:hypothetical protein